MVINSFWAGSSLSKLEELTIKSFAAHGHTFVLWQYPPFTYNYSHLPVTIQDANEIVPYSDCFTYTGKGDCPKGSLGGFSDIFRYYLLYRVGGWYVDMDVTCLQSFSALDDKEWVIRPHHKQGTVANIIKAPRGYSPLLQLAEQTQKLVTRDNTQWVTPLKLFNDFVTSQQLNCNIAPREWFWDDNITDLERLLQPYFQLTELPEYAIHWCNTAISTGQWHPHLRISKASPPPFSSLLKYYFEYDLSTAATPHIGSPGYDAGVELLYENTKNTEKN